MAKKATAAAVSAQAREYFLTYLLPTGFTESELSNFKKEIAELVTKNQGSVVSTEEWGKKRLAYKIKHAGKWHTEAVYVHLVLAVEPSTINDLERDVYLNTRIMRHLLVVADDKPSETITLAKTETTEVSA